MEIISKDKPKGKAYGINKKMKKAKRLEEEKKFKRLTENKRKNAENRKERRIEKEEKERVSQVTIKDFVKNMLVVEIEGKVEKRAIVFDKSKEIKNLADEIDDFEVKLYGNMWKISNLKRYAEKKEELVEKIGESLK